MKKQIRFGSALVAAMATGGAMAAPAVDFGAGTPVAFDDFSEAAVAINPANGTEFVLLYGDAADNDLVVEVRSIATGMVTSTATLTPAFTNYSGDGELDAGWSPDGNTIVVGWGEGDDAGVAFQVYTNTLAPVGSIIDLADGVNKPKFDFFSDNNFLVAYEAGEGVDGSGAFMREFNAAGVEQTVSAIVLSSPDIAGDQNDPEVYIRRTGVRANDVVVTAWEDNGNTRFVGDDDVNYRVFDSMLAPVAAYAPQPATNLVGVKAKMGNPAIGVGPLGEIVIVSEVETVGSDEEIWGGFIDENGMAVSPNATQLNIANGNRNQNVDIRYNATVDAFVYNWNERGSNNIRVSFADVTGMLTGSEAVISSAETDGARGAKFDMVGDTAVSVWRRNTAPQGGFFRVYSIVDNASSVTDWGLYN